MVLILEKAIKSPGPNSRGFFFTFGAHNFTSQTNEAYTSGAKETHGGDEHHHHPRVESIEAGAHQKEAGPQNHHQAGRSGQEAESCGKEEVVKRIYWIPIGVVALLLIFALAAWLNGNKGPKGDKLTRREEKAVHANIGKQRERAKRDTLASAALDQKATRTEATIQTMRKEAVTIHKRSITHAKPVPTTTAGLDSLSEFLNHYGDSPNGDR